MKTATRKEVLEYRNNPYGGFLGNITFVDSSYKDFRDLKDEYSSQLDSATNKFCIIHEIDFIFDYEENLETKLDDLLGEYSESYLIPSVYDGEIIWDI